MLKLLHKIMVVGTVTEGLDAGPLPSRSRGQVIANDGSCAGCGTCQSVCPTGAISYAEEKVTIDNCSCIFCGRCVENCPQQQLNQTSAYKLAELSGQVTDQGDKLRQRIIDTLGRSLHIRHLDVGSCNACDWEMVALSNPLYDLQQYGIDFVASPRHADLLMVTGVVTRNLAQAVTMTYEATPSPKLVMAVGACAAAGNSFGQGYAIRGGVDKFIPVDIYVPGCPPRPQALIYGLLLALDKIS
jgi:Ni,Fe-hydrogenase III small subunit/NAD-dependent dihydropyrimidine dehydrogenase PreA subunit